MFLKLWKHAWNECLILLGPMRKIVISQQYCFLSFSFVFFFSNTSWQHLPLNRSSKQILKQDCMISQTDSFVRWAPTGVNSSVRKTCSIFIKTTSSLLGSVPTKRAWVTASARLSIPEGVLLDAGSTSEWRWKFNSERPNLTTLYVRWFGLKKYFTLILFVPISP